MKMTKTSADRWRKLLLNMIDVWAFADNENGEIDWDFLTLELGLTNEECDELIGEFEENGEEKEKKTVYIDFGNGDCLVFETGHTEKGDFGYLNVSLSICQLALLLNECIDNDGDAYFTIDGLKLYYNNDDFDYHELVGILKDGKWLVTGFCFYD